MSHPGFGMQKFSFLISRAIRGFIFYNFEYFFIGLRIYKILYSFVLVVGGGPFVKNLTLLFFN